MGKVYKQANRYFCFSVLSFFLGSILFVILGVSLNLWLGAVVYIAAITTAAHYFKKLTDLLDSQKLEDFEEFNDDRETSLSKSIRL